VKTSELCVADVHAVMWHMLLTQCT